MLQIRVDDMSHGEEATKLAIEEAIKIRASWDQPSWDELDWSRIKELRTRELVEHRKQEAIKIQRSRALDCKNFVKHVRLELC